MSLRDVGGSRMCPQIASNASWASFEAWRHLVVVNAWNEWGEQSVIEPTEEDGSSILDAHRGALEELEKEIFSAPTTALPFRRRQKKAAKLLKAI